MSGDLSREEETEVVSSDDEIESVCESNVNGSDLSENICSAIAQEVQIGKNNSASTASFKSERNCPFSIDSILGRSNKFRKLNSDSISNNSNRTEFVSASEVGVRECPEFCKWNVTFMFKGRDSLFYRLVWCIRIKI